MGLMVEFEDVVDDTLDGGEIRTGIIVSIPAERGAFTAAHSAPYTRNCLICMLPSCKLCYFMAVQFEQSNLKHIVSPQTTTLLRRQSSVPVGACRLQSILGHEQRSAGGR